MSILNERKYEEKTICNPSSSIVFFLHRQQLCRELPLYGGSAFTSVSLSFFFLRSALLRISFNVLAHLGQTSNNYFVEVHKYDEKNKQSAALIWYNRITETVPVLRKGRIPCRQKTQEKKDHFTQRIWLGKAPPHSLAMSWSTGWESGRGQSGLLPRNWWNWKFVICMRISSMRWTMACSITLNSKVMPSQQKI